MGTWPWLITGQLLKLRPSAQGVKSVIHLCQQLGGELQYAAVHIEGNVEVTWICWNISTWSVEVGGRECRFQTSFVWYDSNGAWIDVGDGKVGNGNMMIVVACLAKKLPKLPQR